MNKIVSEKLKLFKCVDIKKHKNYNKYIKRKYENVKKEKSILKDFLSAIFLLIVGTILIVIGKIGWTILLIWIIGYVYEKYFIKKIEGKKFLLITSLFPILLTLALLFDKGKVNDVVIYGTLLSVYLLFVLINYIYYLFNKKRIIKNSLNSEAVTIDELLKLDYDYNFYKLGKLFILIKDNIQDSLERNYLGDLFVGFNQKNEGYIKFILNYNNKICEYDIKSSDIVSIKKITINDNNIKKIYEELNSLSNEYNINAQNINNARIDNSITKLTTGNLPFDDLNRLRSDIKLSNKMKQSKEIKELINKKNSLIKELENTYKITLANDNSFLVSHIKEDALNLLIYYNKGVDANRYSEIEL